MKQAVLTGGSGFIGRWVAKALLDEGWSVVALDDFSNSSPENVAEFASDPRFDLIEGTIADRHAVARAFAGKPSLCLHLAAQIRVQDSIDDPVSTFLPDVDGTLFVLEAARACGAPFLFMSSCMVYAEATGGPITETHPVRPASPYAASKLSGEFLTLSYGLAYGHPVSVVRPFNTYGPFQRTTGEGGVVAIFCDRALRGEPIDIFGDGTQTRDLLYVEDCAELVLRAALSDSARNRVLNGGTGRDVSILELAEIVGGGRVATQHVAHPHPQAEIQRLVCDSSTTESILGWHAATSLENGVEQTAEWLRRRQLSAR